MRRGEGLTGGYEETVIKLRTYNLRNWRNFGLKFALRGMEQANVDRGKF